MCNDNLLCLSCLYPNFLHNSLKLVTLSNSFGTKLISRNLQFYLPYKLVQSENWFIIKDQQPVTRLLFFFLLTKLSSGMAKRQSHIFG